MHQKILGVAAMLALLLLAGVAGPVSGAKEAAIYTITLEYEIQNTSSNRAMDVEATIYLYDNFAGWASQRVLFENILVDNVPVSPQIFREEDNRWTKIQLGEIGGHRSKKITVVQTLEAEAVDFHVDPSLVGSSIPPELLKFTVPVPGLWESGDPRISETAARLVENTPNIFFRAKNIFDFVISD